jgi:hypothetical protein
MDKVQKNSFTHYNAPTSETFELAFLCSTRRYYIHEEFKATLLCEPYNKTLNMHD